MPAFQGLSRRRLLAVPALTLAAPAVARAAEPIKIRCSLDTAPSHPRNVGIVDYLEKLSKASNGEIVGEVFHSGQLFTDLNVSKALLQGQVEMAVPGAWVLTGFVPDCDLVQLPYFYGVPLELTHKATDGKPGAFVNQQLEAKLKSRVIGRYIDLGYQNWYSTRVAIDKFSALKGLKIRGAGGAGISWRVKFAGGIANTTAWPNVPLALSQGTFDGFISSDESCNSAKLWESGVRYSYADHQFMAQYTPMLSNALWGKLSPRQQELVTGLWVDNIDRYNAGSLASQANARKVMQQNNVKFFDPSPDELAATRSAMLGDLDTMVHDAKLSPEVVKLVKETVG
jgi:TRAP-type transport system periplasmic protein